MTTEAAIAQARGFTFREAVEVLAAHQDWRRGAETAQMHPDTLGDAIDTIIDHAREMYSAKGGLTEQQKADRDAVLYGAGYMMDGKHVPLERITIATPPAQAAEAVEYPYNTRHFTQDEVRAMHAPSAEAVERVAKAIAVGNNCVDGFDIENGLWRMLEPEQQVKYRAMARAAIAAMQAGEG